MPLLAKDRPITTAQVVTLGVVGIILALLIFNLFRINTTPASRGGRRVASSLIGPAPSQSLLSLAPTNYSGWETYYSMDEGLSFRYPSTWSVDQTSCSADCIDLTSPTASGSPYVYQLDYHWSPSALTIQQTGVVIHSIYSLDVSGSKTPFTLASFGLESQNPQAISGVVVTDQTFVPNHLIRSVPANLSQKTPNGSFTLSANLLSPNSSNPVSVPWTTYQAQPDYVSLIGIFRSLRYN